MKDTEKCNKVKLGKLEDELLVQKQANTQLTKDLEEKNHLSSQLKASKTKKNVLLSFVPTTFCFTRLN